MSGGPWDMFRTGGPFDQMFNPNKAGASNMEKGQAWRAKVFDGKLFLPAEQVIELLRENDVLPKTRERLEGHVATQAGPSSG